LVLLQKPKTSLSNRRWIGWSVLVKDCVEFLVAKDLISTFCGRAMMKTSRLQMYSLVILLKIHHAYVDHAVSQIDPFQVDIIEKIIIFNTF
jgi:hypothetical protein